MQSPSIGEAEDSRSSQVQEEEKRGKTAFTQWGSDSPLPTVENSAPPAPWVPARAVGNQVERKTPPSYLRQKGWL